MVHAAKALAVNMNNPEKASDWRRKNNLVSLSCKSRQIISNYATFFARQNGQQRAFFLTFSVLARFNLLVKVNSFGVRRQMSDQMAEDVFDLYFLSIEREVFVSALAKMRALFNQETEFPD